MNREIKYLKNKIDRYETLKSRIEDVDILIQLGIEEGDPSVMEEAQTEIGKLEKSVETLRLETLLSGPYDRNNAIISIHAGAGGTEAMDWASMLLRMYTRWCESKGYQVETLDLLPGEESNKKCNSGITGENAHGYQRLRSRLVRFPLILRDEDIPCIPGCYAELIMMWSWILDLKI